MPGPAQESDPLEAARREKLHKIVAMGIDPWGGRLADRTPIGRVRSLAGQIKFKTSSGERIDLPELGEDVDFRGWLSQQGEGQLVGPPVRAAGRIVLQRDKGKLLFVDIRDWTGQVQLFIGKNQVGQENWELARRSEPLEAIEPLE